jgi:ribosomal protein S18 acetylase RimI-like enzyme
MRVSLRSVTPGDAEFLYEVYASTRTEELAGWGWEPGQWEPFLRSQFEARRRGYLAAFPRADDRVILRDDVPVGRLLVSRAGDHIRLVDIALLPLHRQQGIGTRLLQDLIEESRRSARPLRLQVARDGRAAGLYARLGFSIVGEDAIYQEMERSPVRATGGRDGLEDLTASVFAGQIDTTFRVALAGVPPLALELFEVSEQGSTPDREQCSLLFRGPHDRVLGQGLCRMEHDALGAFVLFVVPIGPDPAGTCYQAVFNRSRVAEGPARHGDPAARPAPTVS